MTRRLVCMALVIVAAVAMPAYQDPVYAQDSADTTSEAGTSGTSESADQSSAESATSDDTTSDLFSPGTADSSQTTDDATRDVTQPGDAQGGDVSSTPQVPSATQTQNQTELNNQTLLNQDQLNQRRSPNQSDATAGGSSTTVEGQARFNAETRYDQQQRDLHASIRFGQGTAGGLTIATLVPGTVFYDSGLRQGDVIISYAGRPIRSQADFVRWVIYEPGQRIPVIVLRDGRQETVYITYPQDARAPAAEPSYDYPPGTPGFLGVDFDSQAYDAAVVRDVLPGSPADRAGLRTGDILQALNGQPIASYQDARKIIGSMRPGEQLDIDLSRRVEDRAQAVLDARPTTLPTAGSYPPAEVRVYRGGPQYGAPPIEQREYEVEPGVAPVLER